MADVSYPLQCTRDQLRVMQFGPTVYRGGVATAIQQLCTGLRRSGHKVLLLGNGGVNVRNLSLAGIEYHNINWSGGAGSLLRCILQVRHHIQMFRPHIIHVHGRWPSLMCHLAGRKPDWFTLHNSHLTERVGALDHGVLRRYLSPMGRFIFVLNREARDYVVSELAARPAAVKIVANGIDCDSFRPPTEHERADARRRFGVDEQEVMALFVGRYDEQKQPQTVIELTAAARDAGIRVQARLFGAGPLQENLERRVRALGVKNVCSIEGWINPLAAYWAADILLMPSLYEGFPLAAAEALACGCPILRTKTGGYEATVQEGVTGFGCDISKNAFIERGLQVLKDRELLQRMRPAARAHAEANLAIRIQTEKTIAAYRCSMEHGRFGVGQIV